MYQEILEGLGLSPNEGKIYEALVESGETSISAVALSANIHRRNAYDAMHRLVEKGLVFQIFSPTENKYNAVDPDKLIELLGEKQRQLEQALPDLKRKFHRRVAPDEAYIYRGLEGQKNIFRDMLRVGADSFFIGAKGGWYEPKIASARQVFFKEANKKGMRFIQLFDHNVVQQMPDFPKHFEGKLEYRVLPKEYSTNSAIHVFGDYVITYTGLPIGLVPESTVFFVLHSKDLAESYRTWFWYMWEQSKPGKAAGIKSPVKK